MLADKIASTEVVVSLQPAPPDSSAPFAAKMAYLRELVANESALEQALRLGTVRVRVPGQARTTRQPAAITSKSTLRGPHKGLDEATRQRAITLRNQGMSYVQVDVELGIPDAVKHKGRVSYLICRDARASGVEVR
jgi:hypothetical protein